MENDYSHYLAEFPTQLSKLTNALNDRDKELSLLLAREMSSALLAVILITEKRK